MLLNPPPVAFGIFTALLKNEGYNVELFDGTLYPNETYYHGQTKFNNLNVRPFSYEGTGLEIKTTNQNDDLRNKVDEFKPHFICVSMLETVYHQTTAVLDVLKNYDIPVMVGGVFPTHAPKISLQHDAVDMACVGEGNECLLHVCEKLAKGEDYHGAPNLAYLKDGELRVNPLAEPVDLNIEPIPNYDLFEPGRFLRPMGGKVWVTIPVETNRGCPYKCTFCNSPGALQQYKDHNAGNFLRKKTTARLETEIKQLASHYSAEFVYFTSDTFLLFADNEFDEFIEMYSGIKIPFWMQTRAETIKLDRMKKLRDVGCFRMSMGLEHGNYDFRKKLLKKPFSDQIFIDASQVISEAGIPLTVNNIIGFPDETRDLIFDTINLNRKLTFDSNNCAFFQPFRGTELHTLSLKKGYIDESHFSSLDGEPILANQPVSHNELRGLKRTFALYTRMEKEYWPQIKRAEQLNEDGDSAFSELQEIFREQFFSEKLNWAN